MCFTSFSPFLLRIFRHCNSYLESPIRAVIGTIDTVYIASGIRISAIFHNISLSRHYHQMAFFALFGGLSVFETIY